MYLKRDVAIRPHVHMAVNSALLIFGRKRNGVNLGERENM